MRFGVVYPSDIAADRTHELARLATATLPPSIADRVKTVLAEAVANAQQANENFGGSKITIALHIDVDRVTLAVSDEGMGFDARPYRHRPMPLPGSLHGRGIPIMERCCDLLYFKRTASGTKVIARWTFAHLLPQSPS